MFGRATITLGIGPHSSCCYYEHIKLFAYDVTQTCRSFLLRHRCRVTTSPRSRT